MSVLDRYIVRTILGAVALVMVVLLILGGLFVFIGQQGDIGVGHYTVVDAMWYTLLNLPQQVYQLLPITALIGSVIGFGQLARGSEITVIRATGVSVARLAGTTLLVAALLIALEGALGEFVAPQLQEAANQQKAFSKYNSVGFGGGAGAWVRDGGLILNVARQSGSRQFVGMQVFELSPQHSLIAIGRAASATAAGQHTWMLGGYTESRFFYRSVDAAAASPSCDERSAPCRPPPVDRVTASAPGHKVLQSNVTAGFLGLAVQDPEQLTLSSLWQLIEYFHTNSLDARQYVFAFWSKIARTVAIAFSVLLALPFVLGSMRSAGAGTRTMLALVIGIVFFLLQRLIESGTIVFNLDPVILAWLPTALLAAVTLFLLARAR
ncbi:MAG TPA: LPS export ABC transporter permease LptG [Steroidobacteraceae bacterium]|nr:LPS export ABC transporter permease LptG [Steroidobacteraceae bacterium]